MEYYDVEYDEESKSIIVTYKLINKTIIINKKLLNEGLKIIFSQELCDKIFQIDDTYYKYFPCFLRSNEMSKKMVEKYGYIFYELYPYDIRKNYELATSYVSHPNTDISYVPNEIKDKKLCDLFMKHNYCTLCKMPLEYNEDWYFDRVDQNCPLKENNKVLSRCKYYE